MATITSGRTQNILPVHFIKVFTVFPNRHLAFRNAFGEAELITKKDLQVELAPIRADISLIKWMMGILLGGVMALLLESFFPA